MRANVSRSARRQATQARHCTPNDDRRTHTDNARPRDEPFNGEVVYSLRGAEIVLEGGGRHYDTVRPHASPGCKPPTPEVLIPALPPEGPRPSRPLRPHRLPMASRPRPN